MSNQLHAALVRRYSGAGSAIPPYDPLNPNPQAGQPPVVTPPGVGGTGTPYSSIKPQPEYGQPVGAPPPSPVIGLTAPADGSLPSTPNRIPGSPGYVAPAPAAAVPAAPAATPAAPTIEGSGWQAGLGRALLGFRNGMAATPETAQFNPIAGGIAGGLAGTGQSYIDALNRRLSYLRPQIDAYASGLKTTADEKAKDSFEEAKQDRIQARQIALQTLKAKNTSTLVAQMRGRLTEGQAADMYDKSAKEHAMDFIVAGIDPASDQAQQIIMNDVATRTNAAKSAASGKLKPAPAAAPAAGGKPSLGDIFK